MKVELWFLEFVERLLPLLIVAIITGTVILFVGAIYGYLKEADIADSRIEALYGQEDMEELKAEYQKQCFWNQIAAAILTYGLGGIIVGARIIVPAMIETAFLRKKQI